MNKLLVDIHYTFGSIASSIDENITHLGLQFLLRLLLRDTYNLPPHLQLSQLGTPYLSSIDECM